MALALVENAFCGTNPIFSALEDEFIYTTLSFSPISATSAGYHRHHGVHLDRELDDFSAPSLDRQRKFYENIRGRLRAASREKLSPEERADYDIMMGQIGLALLELDTIQSFRHNPTVYVELIGNALFNPLSLEYAPKPERIRDIIARAEKIPAFLDQAKANLTDSPEIWTQVAAEENEGNIDLLEHQIPAQAPAELRADFDRAAKRALAALHSFQDYLKDDLAKRTHADWRLGHEIYQRKFRYTLSNDLTPEQVLRDAEANLKTFRAQMLELARSMKMPHTIRGDASVSAHDVENLTIKQALDHIAQRHATPDTYMAEAKRDLAEARDFVKAKNLLTLPPRDNLQVIDTPEFMRGIYAVGGFNQAPALEPQLGAFYWVTPIPKTWPEKRIESKLREYNFYKLKLLTIHEAMPGHYVQIEISNDVEPKSRRVLRAVWGSGTHVEGWAQYSEQMLLDAGYLASPPELKLTWMKEMLRVFANAILDVRLHTLGMTDQEALDLMEKQTFQETEEATAKLQRAKLSSCQLPMYFVGWRDWLRVRDADRAMKGSSFSLRDFHDRALKEGAVPLPVLAQLLTGKPLAGRPSK